MVERSSLNLRQRLPKFNIRKFPGLLEREHHSGETIIEI
jgi:hypothetical protein